MYHRVAIIALCSLFSFTPIISAQQPEEKWKAGVAKIAITPKVLMWMSGYASRTKPAEGKLHDLWAKALVLQDSSGKKHVLVTLDLVGIPRELSVTVCKHITGQYGIPRQSIILSTSHTHTGPVVRSNLNVMYDLEPKQQQYLQEYGEELEKKIVDVVGQALKSLALAKVSWNIGQAGFAVNRRNNKEADVPKLKEEGKLKGPVDHDVPVFIGQFDGTARQGVLIRTAARPEHGNGPRMRFFQLDLGKTRIIPGPFV